MAIQIDPEVDRLLEAAAGNLQLRIDEFLRKRDAFSVEQWNALSNWLFPVLQVQQALSLVVRDLRQAERGTTRTG
jgi:hypothetical protein